MLIARVLGALPLLCPVCSAPMRVKSVVTDRDEVRRILEHVGEDADPPPLSPARGPPQAELDLDPHSQGYGEADQTLGAADEQDLDQSAGLPEDHWA